MVKKVLAVPKSMSLVKALILSVMIAVGVVERLRRGRGFNP